VSTAVKVVWHFSLIINYYYWQLSRQWLLFLKVVKLAITTKPPYKIQTTLMPLRNTTENFKHEFDKINQYYYEKT